MLINNSQFIIIRVSLIFLKSGATVPTLSPHQKNHSFSIVYYYVFFGQKLSADSHLFSRYYHGPFSTMILSSRTFSNSSKKGDASSAISWPSGDFWQEASSETTRPELSFYPFFDMHDSWEERDDSSSNTPPPSHFSLARFLSACFRGFAIAYGGNIESHWSMWVEDFSEIHSWSVTRFFPIFDETEDLNEIIWTRSRS